MGDETKMGDKWIIWACAFGWGTICGLLASPVWYWYILTYLGMLSIGFWVFVCIEKTVKKWQDGD